MKLSTTKSLLKCIILISFLSFNITAQIKKEVVKDTLQHEMKDSVAKKSYFKFSASYLSNYVYNGRRDTITTPYIAPSLGYFSKSGFNISASGYYLNAANQHRFDFFSFDLNYKHQFTDDFAASLVASRTFYNKSSTSLSSNIKGDFGGNVDYDFDFIELFVETSAVFSQKTDFDLYIELEHEFEIKNGDDEFKITPTFDVNFSTLNYYEGYLNKKIGKKKLTNVDAVVSVDNNKFTLMDYEFSLPISYETNKFVFFVTPTYAIPKNTIYTTTVTTTKLNNGTENVVTKNSTSTTERELKQSFFIEAGMYYKFDL
jgi:hypothetical protein